MDNFELRQLQNQVKKDSNAARRKRDRNEATKKHYKEMVHKGFVKASIWLPFEDVPKMQNIARLLREKKKRQKAAFLKIVEGES